MDLGRGATTTIRLLLVSSIHVLGVEVSLLEADEQETVFGVESFVICRLVDGIVNTVYPDLVT